MLLFLFILTIDLFMSGLKVHLIENNKLLLNFILCNCAKYILSINYRRKKLIIYVDKINVKKLLNFLAKSMFIRADNLLDLGSLIIQIEVIDLKLVICVIFKI